MKKLLAVLVLSAAVNPTFSQQSQDQQFYNVVKNVVLEFRSGNHEASLAQAEKLVSLLRSLTSASGLSETNPDKKAQSDLITPSPDSVIQSRTTSITTKRNSGRAYSPATPTAKPSVAENGSYYGEISKNTGRPKTVYVRGYYRKDGTYVRGHYRSRPRR